MLPNASPILAPASPQAAVSPHHPLVVFVTDHGFLVPSLVAARQLVSQGVHKLADIVVYAVGLEPAYLARLAGEPALRHIRFESLAHELFAPPGDVQFFKNHVPATSLARLALPEVIPASCDSIVYLDGDVQVVGDISALVRTRVPDGWIMAGRGSAWLDIGRTSRIKTPPDYLAGLGGVAEERYFNAGVLAFSRSTWENAAPRALQFFFDNSQACIRHDQSALNAVFKDRVIELAPRYNFHSAYADLHVQDRYDPAIIHFTGPRKPWGHATGPWKGRFQSTYRRLVDDVPSLAPYLTIHDAGPVRSFVRDVKASVAERRRVRADWDEIAARRQAFFRYVESTPFPC